MMSVQLLEHEAMGTVFYIKVASERDTYARQAVNAAFDELRRLDALLSVYVENSDVSRINRLPPVTETIVDVDTFGCLKIALQMEQITNGAFNVAYDSRPRTAGQRAIDLLPAPCRVRVRAEGVRLDLGGIGKGYALDRMAALLRDWEVTSTLCWSSESTFLATEPPPREPGWAVHFGPSAIKIETALKRRAISGSGNLVKGAHIVDPSSGRAVESRRMTWAAARTAAQADAFSTALMVMSRADIETLLKREPDVGIFVTSEDGLSWAVTRRQSVDNIEARQ
jgi:thiamine biosynthesis lipoprotein